MFKKILWYFKWIVMELYNFITDLAVPFVGVVTVIATVLPVPVKYVAMLKIAEEFLKKLGATKQDVKNKFNRRKI